MITEKLLKFKYEEEDIISDTIINYFYNYNGEDKSELEKTIIKYIEDECFFKYVQKNILINKINHETLIKIYSDYEGEDLIENLDMITKVTTTKWI